ncbi:lamin tail domain-containing protein [Paenibacillus whitsoniae]|uniref:LTD domain-containing protein n=1 Tax=Paenibacillus whitsoniae TaxID=2496558 RepID=A0A430J795_9BACL|nr:lamin tail domain-containing protein [Paenibacillus whitsoniae]RTE05450.1 hypothetical protein EJQ19_24780 [Paenibacillus whitsoniae]
MKSSIKGFILGVVTTCLLFGATAAYAAGGTMIEVYFEKLKYIFDGTEKQPTADQGQGFIYKGTTYVPLRFVTESLGKEVGWNDAAKTITIGKPSTTPAAPASEATPAGTAAANTTNPMAGETIPLTSIAGMIKEDEASMLNVDAWGKGHNTAVHKPAFRIGGTTFATGLGLYHHNSPYPPHIKTGGTVQYPLDGNYTKLTAQVGADESSISDTAKGTIKFIGDGRELLVVSSIKSGEAARPIEVDVTNVKVLRINFNSDRNGLINQIIGDPQLTPASIQGSTAPSTAPAAQSDIIIVERDKKSEYIVLKNRSRNAIDLKGWRVLSVNGSQSYTFKDSFSLGPDSYVALLSGDEGKSFAATGASTSTFRTYSQSLLWTASDVWNNTETDAAELYDPQGTKVSEYIN